MLDSHRSADSRSRVLLLLVDGFDYRLARRYLDSMPRVRQLMEAGYHGQVLPFASTWGNVNFNSLLTGTAPGTHYRLSAPPSQQDLPGPAGCTAETVWQALGAEGRKSVLIGCAGAYPTGTKWAGVVAPLVRNAPVRAALFGPRVYQTADLHTGLFELGKVDRSGWPPGRGPTANRRLQELPRPMVKDGELETTITLADGVCWRAVLSRNEGHAYESLCLYRPHFPEEAVWVQKEKWTEWVEGCVDGRPFKVRFRLLHVSADGRSLSVLASAGCPLSDFSEPAELGEMILSHLGPASLGTAIPPRPDDPHYRVGMEECLEGALWVVEAGRLAFEKWGAELWVHKTYALDNANHQCAAMIDPIYDRYDAARAPAFDRVLRQAYVDLDTVIGRLLDVAQSMGNTHVVVSGDHGICINNVVCDVNRRLQDVGLLAMRADGTLDFSGTLVYAKPSRQGNELFVNLRGRSEDGVVDPQDYVEVQERAIDALLDWRGPGGKRAACFALKKREAQIVGYWGEECGDVFFAYNQGFTWGVNPGGETIAASTALTTNHGAGVQTQDTGVTSNMGILIAWGPKVRAGVKRDVERLGPIPIHNIGPTITELLGCRRPRHATGGVIGGVFV